MTVQAQAEGFNTHPRAEVQFERLYEEHFAFVWRSLLRLGVRNADLADVTQEVFLVVWRKSSSIDLNQPLRSWLFAVAFRVASSYRRRAWFRRERPSTEPDAIDPALSPEASANAQQQLERMALALSKLDMKSKAVVVLHDLEETPMHEIASALKLPLKTAYARLYAGRQKFIRALRQDTLSEGKP